MGPKLAERVGPEIGGKHSRPFGAVLTWDEHDRRHQPNPLTGRRLYLLDEAPDHPGLRHCNYCGAYVQRRTGPPEDEDGTGK